MVGEAVISKGRSYYLVPEWYYRDFVKGVKRVEELTREGKSFKAAVKQVFGHVRTLSASRRKEIFGGASPNANRSRVRLYGEIGREYITIWQNKPLGRSGERLWSMKDVYEIGRTARKRKASSKRKSTHKRKRTKKTGKKDRFHERMRELLGW